MGLEEGMNGDHLRLIFDFLKTHKLVVESTRYSDNKVRYYLEEKK